MQVRFLTSVADDKYNYYNGQVCEVGTEIENDVAELLLKHNVCEEVILQEQTKTSTRNRKPIQTATLQPAMTTL